MCLTGADHVGQCPVITVWSWHPHCQLMNAGATVRSLLSMTRGSDRWSLWSLRRLSPSRLLSLPPNLRVSQKQVITNMCEEDPFLRRRLSVETGAVLAGWLLRIAIPETEIRRLDRDLHAYGEEHRPVTHRSKVRGHAGSSRWAQPLAVAAGSFPRLDSLMGSAAKSPKVDSVTGHLQGQNVNREWKLMPLSRSFLRLPSHTVKSVISSKTILQSSHWKTGLQCPIYGKEAGDCIPPIS